MKKITTKGNLPKPLQIFAKTMARDERSTEFYECESSKELETLAKEKKCELQCILDRETARGYLTGFDVQETKIQSINGTSFMKLIMYFTEIGTDDYHRYKKLLNKHRTQQEDDMQARQVRAFEKTFKPPVEED